MKYIPRVRRVTRLSRAAAAPARRPPAKMPTKGGMSSFTASTAVAYPPMPTNTLLPSEM